MTASTSLTYVVASLVLMHATVSAATCEYGCAEGYFFSNCTASCVKCSSGFYCGGNLTMPQPCPAGSYNTNEGSVDSTSCIVCAAGEYSVAGSPTCTPCPWNQFSQGNSSACSDCGAGFVANATKTGCTECAAGTFASNTSGTCMNCSAGFACPSKTMDREVLCAAGTYSYDGLGICQPCEAGYACPSTVTQCTSNATLRNRYACPLGTYSVGSQSYCTSCPPMKYCPFPENATVLDCPSGFYSMGGSYNCSLCPPGFYCPANSTTGQPLICDTNTTSASGAIECTICPAGYQCPNANTQIACVAGMYSLAGAVTCSTCPAGSYCSSTSVAPIPCPGGTFSAGGVVSYCTPCNDTTSAGAVYQNGTGRTTCNICPAGSYCPNTYSTPTPCPLGFVAQAGSFTCTSCTTMLNVSSYTAQEGSTTCTVCHAGSYCPDVATILPCPLGSYSGAGSYNCTRCPAGYMCPIASGLPILCTNGTYSLDGMSSCLVCPVNHMCPNPTQSPILCSLADGWYSPLGSTECFQCPSGTQCAYNPQTGNISFSLCAAGTYRLVGASLCKLCPPGYMCPYPDFAPIRCPAGMYSIPGQVECSICPAGRACNNRTAPVLCFHGQYSAAGDTECHNCPPGYRCPVPWIMPIACMPGQYSEGSATNCTACPAGWQCPSVANFVGAASICPQGSFSVGSQTYCSKCPGGYECPSIYNDIRTPCAPGYYSYAGAANCTFCPAGYECPTASGDIVRPRQCQRGTFSDGGQQHCTECPAGYACPVVSSSNMTVCKNGTFSFPRSTSCTTCAAGHYCPSSAVDSHQPLFGVYGIGAQVPCSAGEFAGAGATQCTKCPTGKYCTSTIASDGAQASCPSGYVTAIGSSYATVGATNCIACPDGSSCSGSLVSSTCGSGTYSSGASCVTCSAGFECSSTTLPPSPCPAGSYSTPGSVSCLPCSAGYVCGVQSVTPTPSGSECPSGSYCPQGTTVAILCPSGTYGTGTGGQSVAQACVDCHAGYFCPAGTAGQGASNQCPAGSYCPPGSPFPTPCPAGTYSNDLQATTRASCVLCPEGYFCPAGTASFAVSPCPPGFYCPPGTGSGFENGCPIGTYTTEYKLTSASQCYQCPSGSYCPSVGLTAPVPCPAGTYQPEPSNTACRPCEPGWACTQIGMTNSFATPCLTGHFCPTGSASPFANPCPAGTYTFKTNLGSKDQCEVCWRGYACPTGTGYSPYPVPIACATGHYCPGVPPPANGKFYYVGSYTGTSTCTTTQFPCPPGTYTGATDLYDASQCSPCPAGEYCPGGGTTTQGPCGDGSFCPPKSWLIRQYPCASGTYQPNTGGRSQADCLPCTVGNYCPEGAASVIQCPAGSYTPFNRTTGAGPSGLVDSTLCLLCPAGYYCLQGSSSPTHCSPGTYSGTGASSCTTCEVGRYCPQNATSADQKERLFLCPAGLYCTPGLNRIPSAQYDACVVGHYCPLGTAVPVACVPGSYNPVTGRASITDCLPCTAGYYCAVSGSYAVTGECDPGYYCPSGASSSTQEPCPARYYRSIPGGASEDFCSVCPRGYYCPEGTADPLPCTRGYYCVTGTEVPQPCPIGTFGNATMLMSQDDCSPCTAGYYCDGLGLPHPTGLCDPGYYCISSAYTSAPPGLPTGGLCPKGGYCPPGSSFPTACAEGTFNNYTGGSTQDDCTSCTPGSYCSGSNLPYPTGLCAAGYYCTGGASLPTQFVTPAGYYSLAGASAPSECPLGTFNPSPAQGACTACIAGYYCPTTGMVTYLPCPAGGYCVAASVLPRACPAGTYNPSTRQMNISNCLACPPGKYCQETNMTAPSGMCNAGFYCKQYCITSTCGRYALNYAGVENTVPAGYANNYGGQCPWGYYCFENTANPIACPAGTIRDALQGMSINDCQACPPRYHCSKVGMSFNIPTNAPEYCSEGYYCPGSINTSLIYGCMDSQCATHQGESCSLDYVDCPSDVPGYNSYLGTFGARACPRGFYCPTGSSRPTICFIYGGGQSTYQNRYAQSTCVVCPRGYWCDPNVLLSLQVPQDCPVGRYCPPGTTQLQPSCPIGSWSDRKNLGNMTECKRCPPGRFCPYTGTYGLSQLAMPFCFGGYWCGGGSVNGYGTVGRLGGFGGPCPPGFYCPNGTTSNVSYACPPGTYKPLPFGSSVGACIVCDPGMYCTGSGKTVVTGKCASGYYCPRGCSDPYCTNKACTQGLTPYTKGLEGGPCPPGSYCPQTPSRGAVLPTACPVGTYQDQIAQDFCKGCPPGWICGTGNPLPQRCGVGRYCPANTSASAVPRCPPGTFNNYVNAQALTECNLCPAGRYCPYHQLNTSWAYCDAGYYCTSGANTAQGTVGPQGGVAGICPRGHYCPIGTKYNVSKPCPPGTFNAVNGSSNITACLSCTPGYYCTGWGNYQVTGLCAAGYYCPSSCQDAQCSNKPCHGNCAHPTPYDLSNPYADGGICPSGFRCPTGSSAPIMCLAGTYTPDSGMSQCIACPIGTWCGVRTGLPQPCPTGHYCPVNTTVSYQFPCPAGTYNPVVNGTDINACLLCPAGRYCLTAAMNTSTANCSAGYYCTSGAAFPNGTVGTRGGVGGVCPTGYYCPTGTQSSTEFACHPSTFNPSLMMTNVTACLPCTGGFYCPNFGQSAATHLCTAGYYCPTGCSDATCSNFGCGGNCVVGTWQGGICPAGYICPGSLTRGQIFPSACPAGTYSPATGRVSCLNCPPGYYCAPTTIVPKPCPLGRYCPTSTNQNMPRCPAGSYNDMLYGRNLTDCTRCAAGRYCARTGNSSYTALCFAGYYCVSGAVDGRGNPGALGGEGGICPAGYYCGNGTTQPKQNACPPGTYQPGLGATNASACLACLPGYYCTSYGMRNVTAPCAAGYYCPGGCIDEYCATAVSCVSTSCPSRACPVGHSCPLRTLVSPVLTTNGATRVAGAITPTPCAAGFYSTSTGLSGCQQCPAGYHCPPGTEVAPNPIICPVGAFCPPGTGVVIPQCPAGSFNPSTGLNSSTQCLLCTPGRVCNSKGMSTPGGICAAGYYCGGGAMDPYGRTGILGGPEALYGRDANGRTICPPGYYCPPGASTPIGCTPGTYNPRVGGSNLTHSCIQCDGGKYCATSALTKPTGPCIGGYFCPRGCVDMRCYSNVCRGISGGDCPVGYYCPNATATPIACPAGTVATTAGATSCPLCPEGHYCPQGTSVPIICPAGRYCPAGTTTTIPTCPIGTFSNQTGLIEMAQCARCTGGMACTVPGLNASNAWCEAGYYCTTGAAYTNGTTGIRGGVGGVCPAGYYCPSPTAVPLACGPGTFNPFVGGNSTASCISCTAGSYCGNNSMTAPSGLCAAGYYCPPGQSTPTPSSYVCPAGHYCTAGTITPYACPGGTFNNATQGTSLSACASCPLGMFCLPGESNNGTGLCAGGWYCTGGANSSTPATNGGECAPGYYCPPGSASMRNCTGGFYCATPGLSVVTGPCDAGHYCTTTASRSNPTDNVTGGVCPGGHYCPIGTLYPNACPSGTYNPLSGQHAPTACISCPAGTYCPTAGMTAATLNCSAGYYCPPGQSIASPTAFICPKGFFCISGSKLPVRCPAGTYQDVTGQSSCKACPAGYYCDPTNFCPGTNYTTPTACPAGHYCLEGTKYGEQYACPPGTYNPSSGLYLVSQCTSCPAGKYCPTGGMIAPGPNCAPGFYCAGGSNTSSPRNNVTGNACPPGYYCPSGIDAPVPCSVGTYNPLYEQFAPQSCLSCPAGLYCPNTSTISPSLNCSGGYYCPPGQSVPTPTSYICPKGHYCVQGSKLPVRCPAGTYQDVTGQSSCKTCPGGFFCNPKNLCPGTNYTTPTACPAGYYCPNGTKFGTQFACPSGTYSSVTGLYLVSECTSCPGGKYCASAGMTAPGPDCDAGHYCTGGSNVSNPRRSSMGGICPAGSYCVTGSQSPTACPAGTFGDVTGKRLLSECTPCTAGMYCGASNLTAPSGVCTQGYYCPGGQSSPTPSDHQCPVGQICVEGSTSWQACPSGTYASGVGQSGCLVCPTGYYCDQAKPCSVCATMPCVGNYTCPRACPLGHYCPQSTKFASQFPCPPGRYGKEMNLQNASACILCPAGQYCPYIGMSELFSLKCSPGYYCAGGAYSPKPTDGVTGYRCPSGRYCPLGAETPLECPRGTFNALPGGTNISACAKCPGGRACTQDGLTNWDATSTAGYYCPGSNPSPAMPQYSCPVGYYCPAGSTTPVPCGSGLWTNTKGQSTCGDCPKGYYCTLGLGALGNVSIPKICPEGYYCPTGTNAAHQFPCPIGTFSVIEGLTAVQNCSRCTGGKACTTPGLSYSIPNCAAGYYCSGGAFVLNPMDHNVTGHICPEGYYCPTGTATPMPCAPGTFSNATGLNAASQCQNCTAGMYCEQSAMRAPSGECSAGFFCPGGQSSPTPNGLECLGGKYCPIGTTFPLDCPNGTYVPSVMTGRGTCFSCPAGFFCNLIQQQLSPYNKPATMVLPTTCPRGYYCRTGTASDVEYPCLPGSFSNVTGLSLASECMACTAGHYCELPGQIKPAGLCEPGFYCARGSNSSRPDLPQVLPSSGGVCPSGRYCLIGSGEDKGQPCPPGFFYSGIGAKNVTWCQRCRGGYYCATPGYSVATGNGMCNEGYYCPGGNVAAATPSFICPVGTYCPQGSQRPIPCPGGTYNPTPGQGYCQSCPEYYFCPRGAAWPTICFSRHVCPAASPYPTICPNGTYAPPSAAAMKSISECALCPAGVYCTNGTISGKCAAGYLCEYGNTVPDPDTSTDVLNKKKGGLCPLGSYCPLGTPVKMPCTNQTVGYSLGLQSASDCSPCRPGYYCIESSVVPIDCPPGYYCPGYVGRSLGLIPCPAGTFNSKMFGTDISWCRPCEAGWYCPVEAMASSKVYPAPQGYYSAPGQTQPYPCPGGTYQAKSNGSAIDTAACTPCPIGHYCGPSATSWNQTCPEGTFCPLGSQYPYHCPGGHYCPRNVPAPVACPGGYYCPPLTTFPRLCWNGTYCPAQTEIPLLCPNGYVSRNDTASRVDLEEACESCPPGTFSTNTLFCELCTAGYVCLGGTSTATPTDEQEDGGYICPIGHYCPTGSTAPTPCPAGRFNNATGGRTLSACYPCPAGFYNPSVGSSTCVRCGKSSTSVAGSGICDCIGDYRSFQPGDGSCRCIPGYIFYSDGQRLSGEDSSLPCQPIVYQRCQPGETRSQTGTCVSGADNTTCASCPDGKGTVDPQIGICACDKITTAQEVCDEKCLSEVPKVFVDVANNSLVYYDPTTGETVAIDLASAGILGTTGCGTGSSTCSVKMVKMDATGSKGVFNPGLDILTAASSTQSTASFSRRLMQTASATEPLLLSNPIVCLNNGDAMIWDVSDPSRTHYPVYLKDSLANTNPTFDYTAFRELADNLRSPNLTIKTFMYTFTTEGLYVFGDNANPAFITMIRVVSVNEVCSSTPFMPITQTSLVTLGVSRDTDLLLAPDWILIGVLMAGLFLLVVGTIGGLWHFRRQTWGVVGTALPKYRSLGMQALARGDFAMLASKGSTTKRQQLLATGEERVVPPSGSSRVMSLRLDTLMKDFVPNDFIKIVSEEAGVDPINILVLSVTEGTVCRFVITGLEDSQASANLLVNRIADPTNEIHGKLPILAYEEEGQGDSMHPANNMAEVEDDFWDYERQIDLEGFNVRTLYDKLEDQTIHIVSQLVNQRDDVLLLADKILVESEALKDMFLRIKLELDERNKKEKELQEIRDAKLSTGQIEFDLPDDLKMTLAKFLEDFFTKNASQFVQSTQNTQIITDNGTTTVEYTVMDGESNMTRTESMTTNQRTVEHLKATPDDERPVTPMSGAEMANVEDFKDIFTGKDESQARKPRSNTVRTVMSIRRDMRKKVVDLPAECQDDSDCEEAERWDRAEKREGIIKIRLSRMRRAIDQVVMPQGLDEREPIPGVLEADQLPALLRQREAYIAERRNERSGLDAVPQQLMDDPSLPLEDRQARQVEREKFLATRLQRMQQVLRSLQPPASLLDDEHDTPEERATRTIKREKFLMQKCEKARKARAELMVPAELDDNSDLEDAERTRRTGEREELAANILIKNPNAPTLPSLDNPNLSEEAKHNLRQAIDESALRRMAIAHEAMANVGVPVGLSDHSDLSEGERRRREAARSGVTSTTPLVGRRGPKVKPAASPNSSINSSALSLKKHEFGVLEVEKVPREYLDDSDLDDEERNERKVMRAAFKSGKNAPVTSAPPEQADEHGIPMSEKDRRQRVNVAFLRGREAKAARDASVGALNEAAKLLDEAERLNADVEARRFVELGKQREKELNTFPADLSVSGKESDMHRLQAAYQAGRVAQTLSQVPEELEEALATTDIDRQRRHDATEWFHKGQAAKKSIEVPEEYMDTPGLSDAERARRQHLRVLFQGGRAAQIAQEVADELEDMGLDRAALHERKAILKKGRDAASANLHELPTELRDDVPLLSEEEINHRRELQCVYLQGFKAQRAAMVLDELVANPSTPSERKKEYKKVFEHGLRAQQEGVPFELQENPDMTSQEKEVLSRHRQAFLRGRQAARLADQAVQEALDGLDASRDRVSIQAAVQKGRAAQAAMNDIPEEIQDVEGLSEEEKQRRLALRNAFKVGKMVRQAGSLPKELPEEEEEADNVQTSRVESKTVHAAQRKGGVSFGGTTTVELPADSLSSEQEKILNRLKKEHHLSYKQLKDKQKSEQSIVLEELEEESIERAKRTDDALTEEFARERKRIQERHTEVLAKAPKEQHDAIKRSQLEELQVLQNTQERERKEAQDLVVRLGQEKKAKMRAILEEKATNEIRLAKTIHNDQDNEIKRIKDDYLLSLRTADIVREEDLKKQKDALLERLRLRERRQKAKANKEKELLEAQLQQTEVLERESLSTMMKEKKVRMIAHVHEVHQNATPEELAEEVARIERSIQQELESENAKLGSRLVADRLEKEKELADRHAEEKDAELKAAQHEVDQLLEAKRRITPRPEANNDEEKIADGVKRSVNLLLQQKRLRDELQRQRREEAEISAKDDLAIKQEAQKEIARRERERGERLTDQQKREIIEECRRNAAKLDAALSDDQRRQQEETKKRLEERRRKKETELHKRQLDEMHAELRRQEEEQQRKATELAKRIVVKAAAVELPPEIIAEEEEMQLRMNRMKEDLQKKHDEEQRILERQLEEELKKQQEKELNRIKNEAQKKKLELLSQQTAKESMQMKEEEKKRLLEEHEAENQRLQSQLDAEGAIQKAKIQDAIEAKRRRKKNELTEKQRAEAITVEKKQEDEKESFVRQAKINNEKKIIEDTMRQSSGAQAQDVAQVVMSQRHREEVQNLGVRQQKRRSEEQETREARLESERTELINRIASRVQAEIDNMPPNVDDREKRINDLQAKAKRMQTEKVAELERKLLDDTQSFMDQLEVHFAEEQLQLKVRQWNEIAAACGMAAPEQALQKYQQRLAQRASDDAEDELMKFRKDREAESARLQERLRTEKESYDKKIKAEMEKLQRDHEEEINRREAAMMEELKKEKERKEQKLREARLAGTKTESKGPTAQESAEIKKRLLEDYKEGEKLIKEQVDRERQQQQQHMENMLKQKREKKRAALERQQKGETTETVTTQATTPTAQKIEDTIKKASVPESAERRVVVAPSISVTASTPSASYQGVPQFAMSQVSSFNGSVAAQGGDAYQQWVGAVVQQLSNSPIMEKLVKIERMLASQVKHGLLSYYLDSKDRQQRSNEGKLEVMEIKELSTPQCVVYCFGQTIRQNISRIGIPLPPIKILIAKSLPDSQTNASAFRCSYYYDHSRRTMYIRQTRLANIGEFVLVMLHGLAHVKSAVADDRANFAAWNDSDPAFLTEFYGLLEVCTEEMFYMRLPPSLAARDQQNQRGYRADSVMSAQSLTAMEQQLQAMGPESREAFLKTYLML